jgi:phosphohistidine swiveling domain-containing protein
MSSDEFSYPQPPLSEAKVWLVGQRPGTPAFLDPYMKVWSDKHIEQYYQFSRPYEDGYWLFRGETSLFKLNIRKFGYSVLDYFLLDNNFKEYLRKWDKIKKQTQTIWFINYKKTTVDLSDEELVDLVCKCQNLLEVIWAVSPLAAMIGDMATEWTNWWLEKKNVPAEEAKIIFPKLFCYPKISETIKRQIAISRKMRFSLNKNKTALRLAQEFAYAKSNFDGYVEYTIDDVLKAAEAARNFSKKEQRQSVKIKKSILKKLGATEQEKNIFSLFGYCQYNRDERMSYEQRLFVLIDRVLSELSKRFLIDVATLKYSFSEELTVEKLRDEKFRQMLKERQKNGLLVYWKDGKIGEYLLGQAGSILFDGVQVDSIQGDKVKGQVAFKGKVKGVVRIINNPKENVPDEPFVLVTSMTSPDFIQFLRKCVAVVTDEGGITCHAAILSRELKKPCIIGTKIATQVLHDGDLVEVDADNGVVRKL